MPQLPSMIPLLGNQQQPDEDELNPHLPGTPQHDQWNQWHGGQSASRAFSSLLGPPIKDYQLHTSFSPQRYLAMGPEASHPGPPDSVTGFGTAGPDWLRNPQQADRQAFPQPTSWQAPPLPPQQTQMIPHIAPLVPQGAVPEANNANTIPRTSSPIMMAPPMQGMPRNIPSLPQPPAYDGATIAEANRMSGAGHFGGNITGTGFGQNQDLLMAQAAARLGGSQLPRADLLPSYNSSAIPKLAPVAETPRQQWEYQQARGYNAQGQPISPQQMAQPFVGGIPPLSAPKASDGNPLVGGFDGTGWSQQQQNDVNARGAALRANMHVTPLNQIPSLADPAGKLTPQQMGQQMQMNAYHNGMTEKARQEQVYALALAMRHAPQAGGQLARAFAQGGPDPRMQQLIGQQLGMPDREGQMLGARAQMIPLLTSEFLKNNPGKPIDPETVKSINSLIPPIAPQRAAGQWSDPNSPGWQNKIPPIANGANSGRPGVPPPPTPLDIPAGSSPEAAQSIGDQSKRAMDAYAEKEKAAQDELSLIASGQKPSLLGTPSNDREELIMRYSQAYMRHYPTASPQDVQKEAEKAIDAAATDRAKYFRPHVYDKEPSTVPHY